MTTIVGLRIARAIYPILLEHGRTGTLLTYGQLADELKRRHPDDEVIANVIPRSLGPRLLLLRAFTSEQGYPDLSSLVVNAATDEVGDAYSQDLDPKEQRELVRAFDWSAALPEFDIYIERGLDGISKRQRPRRSRDEAKNALWQFAKANPGAHLPSPAQREAVLQVLMDGEDVEVAIADVLPR